MKNHKQGKIPVPITDSDTDNPDSEIRTAIAERIQKNRAGRVLSAKAVAEAVGMTRSALTQIETGRNNVSALVLWKLSCVLGCPVNDFFPKTPDGFELSKMDLTKLGNEDEKVVGWAKKCFPNGKKI